MSYFIVDLKEQIARDVQAKLKLSTNIEFSNPNPKFGADLAIPVFKLAAGSKTNPQELAQILAEHLSLSELNQNFKKIEAVGGFVNFWLATEVLAKGLSLDLAQKRSYGTWPIGKDNLIIVDYIGLNMAKPFSVGHLRPTLQGQALVNLYRVLGYKVIGDTHVGDSGTPFGIWVVGFNRLSSEEDLREGGAYELGRVYAKTKQLMKEEEGAGNTKLKSEAAAWLKKLESGDTEALAYQQKFNAITQAHMFEILEELGVNPDENLGESVFLKRGKELSLELVQSGIAQQEADQSIIVNLEEFGIDTPILLQKSDGTALYATTDIAAIEHRLNNYAKRPQKILYSTDLQQRFHFEQLFALATKLKWTDDLQLIHAWFGQIQEFGEAGKRQKMSSRQGAMYIRDLIDRAMEFATQTTLGRDLDFSDIRKIALGAIKFNDFAQDRKTNILFDWGRMFSLQGFSGPFVQYAAVRINSILTKLKVGDACSAANKNLADFKATDFEDYDFEPEKNLLLKLSILPEVILSSAEKYEPHHLATYAFELAQEFNRYYEKVNVSEAEGSVLVARIWILKFSYLVLENALGILGIEIPTKM